MSFTQRKTEEETLTHTHHTKDKETKKGVSLRVYMSRKHHIRIETHRKGVWMKDTGHIICEICVILLKIAVYLPSGRVGGGDEERE